MGMIRCLEITVKKSYLNFVKVKEVIRLIESDGWIQVRQGGSHRQFSHPEKRDWLPSQASHLMILPRAPKTVF
jgi:predicted RNA binding protein YcfA (HicA-like mRNA interferase family)